MPSPLKNWELKNIQDFLHLYLKGKLKDQNIVVLEELQGLSDLTHFFIIQHQPQSVMRIKATLHLEQEGDITIQILPLEGRTHSFKIILKPEDVIKLRRYLNAQVVQILNLYFTGKALRDWMIEGSFPLYSTLGQQLAKTQVLRLFQEPGLKDNAQKKEEYTQSISRILKEMADYTPTQNEKGETLVQKTIQTRPEIGGKLQRGAAPGKGGIYYEFSEFSWKNLSAYHLHHFQRIDSVEYWIANALEHSTYLPQHYRVVQPLSRYKGNRYAMTASMECPRTLPRFLTIKIDRYPVLIKTRYLGSENSIQSYKFTLNKEVVFFLNGYFYLRAIELLKSKLRLEIQSTTSWLLYCDGNSDLVSKVCLLMNTDFTQTKDLKLQDILNMWHEITGQPHSGQDRQNGKLALGGTAEIIRNDENLIIGLFYSFNTLAQLLLHLDFRLYLSQTLSSQDYSTSEQSLHAHAFDGSELARKTISPQAAQSVPDANKRVKYTDSTQSLPSQCIFREDEGDFHVMQGPELSKIFPPIISAADMKFFKARKIEGNKPSSLLSASNEVVLDSSAESQKQPVSQSSYHIPPELIGAQPTSSI